MEKYNIEPFKDRNDHNDFRKEEAYIRAKKRVDSLKGFYWHLAVYVVVNLFLIILIGSSVGYDNFGPYATAFFWGIGLAFHFLGVFGPDYIFGRDWEEQKIREYMEKDQNEFNRFHNTLN